MIWWSLRCEQLIHIEAAACIEKQRSRLALVLIKGVRITSLSQLTTARETSLTLDAWPANLGKYLQANRYTRYPRAMSSHSRFSQSKLKQKRTPETRMVLTRSLPSITVDHMAICSGVEAARRGHSYDPTGSSIPDRPDMHFMPFRMTPFRSRRSHKLSPKTLSLTLFSKQIRINSRSPTVASEAILDRSRDGYGIASGLAMPLPRSRIIRIFVISNFFVE